MVSYQYLCVTTILGLGLSRGPVPCERTITRRTQSPFMNYETNAPYHSTVHGISFSLEFQSTLYSALRQETRVWQRPCAIVELPVRRMP